MIRFECDYTEGAAPEIMDRLLRTNMEQTCGYSEDHYSDSARQRIREACCAPEADVHFLVGGTQTNTTVIAAALRPYQGVIAAASGHVNVHETGAIEGTGHKVLVVDNGTGKVNASMAAKYCEAHFADASHEHIVQPGMIYISQPTESGALYSLGELEALRAVCDRFGLYLYADGARLGYALAAEQNDVRLEDLYRLTDVFYIGGTKVGALFGEVVVIRSAALKRDFRYMIKRQGGMLAKGRMLGLQFDTLFTDDLYFRISKNAVEQALRIKAAFASIGCAFLQNSYTNQQFPILSDAQLAEFGKRFSYCFWEKTDDTHSAVRFCTSWATRASDVDMLIAAIKGVAGI